MLAVLALAAVGTAAPSSGTAAPSSASTRPAFAVTATIYLRGEPTGVAVYLGPNTIYVAEMTSPGPILEVIRGTTPILNNSLLAGTTGGVAVDPFTNRVYVASFISDASHSGGLTIFHAIFPVTPTSVDVGKEPFGVAVNPLTNRIYVANYSSGTVSVVNGATNTVTATIPMGSNPSAVTVNPLTDRIYVTHALTSGTVSVIDGTADKVTDTIEVGKNPNAVGTDPAADTLYVVDGGSNTVGTTRTQWR